MKNLLLALLLLLSLGSQAQNTARIIDWKLLAKVDFIDKYHDEIEAWYLVPEFSKAVKELENEMVIIKGYTIPLDVEGGEYALSAYPFSACFFCGGAGPESVISLQFKGETQRFKTDQVLFIKGKLSLNTEDFYDFPYILKECEVIEK